ncbi:MAG TPA: phosphatidylglycerol lysyltransferase domain-containing protein [Pyrinomonadaceae bacterium]|jgi:phosphatidylglycerol lysyltransferase
MRESIRAYERAISAVATAGPAPRPGAGWRGRLAVVVDLGTRERLHRFLLWLVALGTAGSGLLNIYSVIGDSLPARTQALEKIFPLAFQHLSRYLTLLIGFALVVSSINIYRRKRRAFWLVLFLSLSSVIFHLTKGIDYEEASASMLLFFTLLVTHKHFNVKSARPSLRQAGERALAGMLIVFCYGAAGFWLLQEDEFGVNFTLTRAVKHTLLIISLAGNPQLNPQTPYARWFADSVYLLTFAAIVYAGLAFFRPIIYRLRTLPQERLLAAGILRMHGRSSLDFFKLWPDKSYYFNEAGNCFIAYRVGNNYAMALADPVGPEEYLKETVRGFLEFCRSNDWGVSFHQTLPDFLPVYHKLGLKRLKIGDEATVDLTNFGLHGRRRRKLRANLNKFEEHGFHIVEHRPPIPDEVLREARRVSDDWLGLPGRRERRFSLGMFDEAYVRSTPLYTLVDARGRMVAFVNRVESYRRGEATIDLMRHLRDAPNGTMDYLFTKLFLDCKTEGFRHFALGMAPLSGFRESEQPTPEELAVHYFMRRLDFLFSYSGLRYYKAKFADSWEPRYLVYQNILTLPQVALALVKVSELH